MKFDLLEFITDAGSIFRKLRLEEGIKQIYFADNMALHRPDMCNFEKGRLQKSVYFIYDVFKLLGYKLTVTIEKENV